MFRLLLLIGPLTSTLDSFPQSTTTSSYKVGEKVAVWNTGWYPAKVIEVKDGLFKVDYYEWTGYPDEWVKDDRIKIWGSTREYKAATSPNTAANKPEKTGNIPNIVGTSWKVLSIYTKGTTPTFDKPDNYIFCTSSHWEFNGNSTANRGTYKVKGNQVIITGQGNEISTYKMTWNEAKSYLELDDGERIIRLQYNVKTRC